MRYRRVIVFLATCAAVVWVGLLWSSIANVPETAVEATPEETLIPPPSPKTPAVQPNGDVILFDFEEPSEVGRFVYGNVNTFVEPTTDMARTGAGSCVVTYYIGAVRQGKRPLFYTLFHPARGRLADWSPYSEFQAAIYNSESFTVTLDLEYADGSTSVWRRYNLPPKVWCRLRQPLSDLASSGLNLRAVKRIGWTQLDTEMVDINTIYIDDVRLTGASFEASKRAVDAAWAAYERWEETEGKGIKAPYLPIIKKDPERIKQIETRYDCGKIDGFVETEVCVVGGGMAGCSAAIASGRLGVDTLLVEQYGFLGGTATAALVTPFMSNRIGNEDLVKGIYEDIVRALQSRGAAKRDERRPGVVMFDDEVLKYVLNNLVINAKAKMMLHTWAEKPLVHNGVCEGVIVNNKSGRLAILAKVVIDSTGDGDIAAKAGCPFEMGRGYDQYTQSVTLFFRMGGVNEQVAFAEQARRVSRQGNQIPEGYMFSDVFRRAVAEGRFPADIPIGSIYFEKTLQPGVVSINATRAFEVDATNVGDLTYASVETRRQAMALADFLRENIPGFERAYLQDTAIQVGVRESRRIIGEYQLTGRDILHGARFPDVIARGCYGIDIHCADPSGCGVVGLKLKEGESYDIPYRCLVPLGVENLLLAGRCISVSHVALGSVRIMPIASGTGHAAGAAAALCVKRGVTPRELPYDVLKQTLISQGANL